MATIALLVGASLAYNVPLIQRPAAAASRAGRIAMDGEADMDFGLSPGQTIGPTAPAHKAEGLCVLLHLRSPSA